ncbi:amidase [Mesobacillus subterraneus]|uniref:Asp-tRNA(Asn)/Glu-tRNA(Gln) amidotransferase GatCAB subunit A n=1 Tax=Mesobacillus subterraneus TaxID=285983 RepID=A0A427TW01_9BACI|nr:amidase [Mesobacillus subterraneus]RSD28629.1 Asp-tRNA(Asn)/Glu-tRNA(Gln) amidotransferase GatCAB subunit A [Mesobacillus subterraneus]
MTELAFLTASELVPLFKSKKVSPVEVIKAVFRRIEKLDPTYRSYITTLPEDALKQAQQAEAAIMRNEDLGPLHGIPVGIKDLYHTKGIRTTSGSAMLRNFIPKINATTVEKLHKAGMVMTGKLNTHEMAGGVSSINPFYGSSRNPWNPNYLTGGSSGGSGAALAAGLATLATGSDTFGSIRVPASMCGVYGIKPTYGLISPHGITPLAASLDHPGPMARSVSDLALMLGLMAGYDEKSPVSLKVKVPDYTKSLNKEIKGLRIGVPGYFLQGLDPEVKELFMNALNTFSTMGAIVTEVQLPELSMSTFAGYVVLTVESGNYHYDMLRTNPAGFGNDVRILFESGLLLDHTHYIRAQQARRKIADALKKSFEEVDILAAPAIPITVPRFQENWILQSTELTNRCMPFTAPANSAGIPSLSAPIGFSSNGLPVGMQLMDNHLREDLLFQAGDAWEKAYKASPLHKPYPDEQ